jgi:hypothetical protein
MGCYELKSYDGVRRQTSCYETKPNDGVRNFLLRLEQLHKSENQTLAKTDRRLKQLHRIALSIQV